MGREASVCEEGRVEREGGMKVKSNSEAKRRKDGRTAFYGETKNQHLLVFAA